MRSIWGLVCFVAACGGGDGKSNTDDPIPAQPLTGVLNGTPWNGNTGRVKSSSTPGNKSIWIYPDPTLAPCTGIGSEPYVVVGMPWVVGDQKVDLQSDNSIFIFMDDTVHVVLDGRIELPDAPTEVGAKPLLRVRASFEDGDDDLFVEGEIAVQLCE